MEHVSTNIKESIRLENNKLHIQVVTAVGKDGDFFVMVSPTLQVSGYGVSEIDAKASFDHNMEVFCDDFFNMSSIEKDNFLKQLGFIKRIPKVEHFSKVFIDSNGALQGIERLSLITSHLETVR